MASKGNHGGQQTGQSTAKAKLEDYEFVEKPSKTGPSSELGRGAYGVVRLVKSKKTLRQYAMKIVGIVELDTAGQHHEDEQSR